MKPLRVLHGLILLLWLALPSGVAFAQEWRIAKPGWQYEFPRDHWPHLEFKTEWWYFTGQLLAKDGRRFGYQVTFFRQGIRPPDTRDEATSRFIVNDLSFAHAALTDVREKKFRFAEKHSRGAFGESGFGRSDHPSDRVAWIAPWQLTLDDQGDYGVHADIQGAELTLRYHAEKPWIPHGANGISQKAAGEGHASHYYSGTRLRTKGTLKLDGQTFEVAGESWFDHEWATNQLTPEQLGWNWFSLQFEDGTELMLYQMRLRNGGLDPNSSGTFIDTAGQTQELARDDYQLEPLRYWESPQTHVRYPIAWRLSVPKLDISAEVTTPVPEQELVLSPISYWEGLVNITGTREQKPLKGHGYMELTGYAGALVGLSAEGAGRPAAPKSHP